MGREKSLLLLGFQGVESYSTLELSANSDGPRYSTVDLIVDSLLGVDLANKNERSNLGKTSEEFRNQP